MPSPANTPPRILCVDDRVSSLEIRQALLTAAGYEVLIASDPPSALAIAGKVEVDLVILDFNFPGQMSGEELAHKLRAANANLPLIMLSGVPDLPESAAASVDVLLMKGAGRPTDLLQAIAKLVQRAHGATDSATQQTSRTNEQTGTTEGSGQAPGDERANFED